MVNAIGKECEDRQAQVPAEGDVKHSNILYPPSCIVCVVARHWVRVVASILPASKNPIT